MEGSPPSKARSVTGSNCTPNMMPATPTAQPYGYNVPVGNVYGAQQTAYIPPYYQMPPVQFDYQQSSFYPLHQASPINSSSQAVPPPMNDELRVTIDKTAEYCASNPALEKAVRERNANDPKFAFLANGEGASYYWWRISSLRAAYQTYQSSPNQQTYRQPAFLPNMPPSNQLLGFVKEYDMDSLVIQHRMPMIEGSLPAGLQDGLNGVLESVERTATSDAIRTGRHWFEANCSATNETRRIANRVIEFMENCDSPDHRLHILYLIHDFVQSQASQAKKSSPSSKSLTDLQHIKPFLVWMARAAFQPSRELKDGLKDKVVKLLSLWVNRGIIDEDDKDEMYALMSATKLDTTKRYVAGPETAHHDARPPLHRGSSALAGSGGFLTPETMPVGMLAGFVRSLSLRAKTMHVPFQPYKPLDPCLTPQAIPVIETISEHVVRRLELFDDDFMELLTKFGRMSKRPAMNNTNNIACQRAGSPRKAVEDSLMDSHSQLRIGNKRSSNGTGETDEYGSGSLNQSESSGLAKKRKPDVTTLSWDQPVAADQAEMGVGADGSVYGNYQGTERAGIGANPGASNDAYENFRKQRSSEYHGIRL